MQAIKEYSPIYYYLLIDLPNKFILLASDGIEVLLPSFKNQPKDQAERS